MYLESEGILDRAKACEVNSEWCDPEKLGRFIASHYFSVEALIALVAIFVAILNLSGLLKPSETRYAEDSLEDQVDLREN
ncbi:MAG: hypothetical protein JXM70_18405 [Pirellulales bacterium]|nr:hypothetical protein [Pirellulales bacterium]